MMGDHGSMGDMAGWMGGAMALAGLLWLLIGLALLVLIVVAAVWLTVRLRTNSAANGRGSPALDDLDGRYARGELDRDAYLQMRRDLDRR